MDTLKMLIPVELSKVELIDVIHDSIDNDEIPSFIQKLDVWYEDFEVTEKTVNLLLDSLTQGFESVYSANSEQANAWKSHVFSIKKLMEEFE